MNPVQQILKWEHSRHKMLVLVLRVILGIIITFKGIVFISNKEIILQVRMNGDVGYFTRLK